MELELLDWIWGEFAAEVPLFLFASETVVLRYKDEPNDRIYHNLMK
jgi:hypothetical protein